MVYETIKIVKYPKKVKQKINNGISEDGSLIVDEIEIIIPPQYKEEFTSHKGKWKRKSVNELGAEYELIEPSDNFFEVREKEQQEEYNMLITKKMDELIRTDYRKQAIGALKKSGDIPNDYTG